MRGANLRLRLIAVLSLVLAAACGDGSGVLSPDDAGIRRTNHSCSDPANPCDLEGIVAVGEKEEDPPPPSSECEIFPWTCDGGGSGGGDGSGGGGESDPTLGVDDYIVAADTLPNCGQVQTAQWTHAYCNSFPPAGDQLLRTHQAFDRIAARGGECANIAAFGRQLLSEGRFRYFPHQELYEKYTGWGGRWGAGEKESGVLLATFWPDDFGDPKGLGYPNFDNKIAHEIEHVMGRDHIGPDQTLNSRACAGL